MARGFLSFTAHETLFFCFFFHLFLLAQASFLSKGAIRMNYPRRYILKTAVTLKAP